MKGQLELSFSVIFSLIIIIATISTAAYFIMHFVSTGQCTTLQLAYADIQQGIDDVWGSAVGDKTVTVQVPSGITRVCFGDTVQIQNETVRELVDAFIIAGPALYALPPQSACDGELASRKVSHATSDSFFCAPVVQGKVTLRMTKAEVRDRMVTLHV